MQKLVVMFFAAALLAAAQGPPPCAVNLSIAGGDAKNVFSTDAVLTATVTRETGSLETQGLTAAYVVKKNESGILTDSFLRNRNPQWVAEKKVLQNKKSERLFVLDLSSSFFALDPGEWMLVIQFVVPGTTNILAPQQIAGQAPPPVCQSVQSVRFTVVDPTEDPALATYASK